MNPSFSSYLTGLLFQSYSKPHDNMAQHIMHKTEPLGDNRSGFLTGHTAIHLFNRETQLKPG